MIPLLVNPITPEETPDKTASVNSRLWSSCLFAWTSCLWVEDRSSIILLKLIPNREISSKSVFISTLEFKSPALTESATKIIPLRGLVIALDKLRPIHSAESKRNNDITAKIAAMEI